MMTIDELITALKLYKESHGGDTIVGISTQEYVGEDATGIKKYYNWKIAQIERVVGATKGTYKELDEKDKYVVILTPIFQDLYLNHDPSVEKVLKE